MTSSARTVDPLPEIDWDAGGIETELGWGLAAVQQGFSRAGTTAVADLPAGPRGYQVLVAITTEEPSSQLALAHRLGIDKTQMTYVVDALEAAALVERRPDPADRRVRQVHPTPAGRTALAAARTALRAAEADLMRHLSEAERTRLRHLLARVALTAVDVAPGTPAVPDVPLAVPGRSRRPTTAPEKK
ncbi:MarR family winged helix-turn-helix transcriptional regulator [Kineococcus sp. GCM10028916]|uniref:MarR family winged helix-turn-helix transcriptional regulator n=1 Tax=Kineococcus sp. GCM10028916 TaxID=3273394 RepID=UPI00363BA5B5